ncbi:MAG: hypothetical protein ACQES0_07475 [Bacteroidota bacterium]
MKLKTLILVAVVLTFAGKLQAQENNRFFPDDYNQRILILPFDPSIYVNDASDMWVKNSDMNHDELKNYLRNQLNRRIQLALVDSCKPIDLTQSYTTEARNDLLGLYTTTAYEMRRAMPDKKEEGGENKFLGKFFEKRKEKKYTDSVVKTRRESGEIRGKRYNTNDKYLHVIYTNPDFIPELAKRRNLDKILFVNQLEIQGSYGNPYISGDGEASRLIKVHYSLYNKSGILLHGGFSSTTIPFRLNDVETVVEDYFPAIVRQIMLNIDFSN